MCINNLHKGDSDDDNNNNNNNTLSACPFVRKATTKQ
jgi:hypothetical protein